MNIHEHYENRRSHADKSNEMESLLLIKIIITHEQDIRLQHSTFMLSRTYTTGPFPIQSNYKSQIHYIKKISQINMVIVPTIYEI